MPRSQRGVDEGVTVMHDSPRHHNGDVSQERARIRRGRLRIYLGAAPGVGKTFAMLDEGNRRRDRGADVVIGFVETHGRTATAAAIGELEVVPRATLSHRGVELGRGRGGPRCMSMPIFREEI